MNSFQVCQFIVVRIDTAAEEKTCITSVDNLVASELIISSGDFQCQKSLPRRNWIDISDHGVRSGGGLLLEDGPGCQLALGYEITS